MLRALANEGCILRLFVISNGIYVILFPPSGDETQGYAIIAIGIFIIFATLHLDRIMEKNNECATLSRTSSARGGGYLYAGFIARDRIIFQSPVRPAAPKSRYNCQD